MDFTKEFIDSNIIYRHLLNLKPKNYDIAQHLEHGMIVPKYLSNGDISYNKISDSDPNDIIFVQGSTVEIKEDSPIIEKCEEKDFYKHHPEYSAGMYYIVQRALDRGKEISEIIDITEISQSTAYEQQNKYKLNNGTIPPPEKKGCPKGSHTKLDRQEEKTLLFLIDNSYTSDYKLTFNRWTLQAISDLIDETFKKYVCPRTVSDIMRRWEYTPQVVTTRSYRQNLENLKR
jgi:transposase